MRDATRLCFSEVARNDGSTNTDRGHDSRSGHKLAVQEYATTLSHVALGQLFEFLRAYGCE